MSSIALRCPTVTERGEALGTGHCYILFAEPRITLRDLITEKVRAELRKARAAGLHRSSLPDLLEGEIVDDSGDFWLHSPLGEQIARRNAINAFERGVFTVAINGHDQKELDTIILLGRETSIAFILPSPVVA
jgi:hypothetical protein